MLFISHEIDPAYRTGRKDEVDTQKDAPVAIGARFSRIPKIIGRGYADQTLGTGQVMTTERY
jgi:hypothetical protein